jgi:hypothetical protein
MPKTVTHARPVRMEGLATEAAGSFEGRTVAEITPLVKVSWEKRLRCGFYRA